MGMPDEISSLANWYIYIKVETKMLIKVHCSLDYK